MKNNIIKEIWEIKTTIDKAIDLQDSHLFSTAQKRFCLMYESEDFLQSISTSTIDCEYATVDDMLFDREQNFAVIAFELSKDKKRASGEDVPVEHFQFSSIFELMWWNCWMFNNMKKNAENDCPAEINMQIYSSINANLSEMINYYKNFNDKISISEQQTCIEILDMVKRTFKELYPNFENIIG